MNHWRAAWKCKAPVPCAAVRCLRTVGVLTIPPPIAIVTKFSFGTLLMLTPLVRVYTRPSSPTVIMPLSPWFSTIRPHNFETSSIDVGQSLVLDAVRVYRDCCTRVQVEMLQRDVSGTNLIPTLFSILLTSLTFASSSSHHVRHLAQLWRTFCIDLSGMGLTPLFGSIYQNTSGQLSAFFHHSTALTSPFQQLWQSC